MMRDFPFFKYLEEYNDAIHEFVFEQSAINHKNDFLNSFYNTCKSMIMNDADLSDKQIKIIEKEMIKKRISIPKIEDYNFTITILIDFKMFKENREIFIDRIELGDFFRILEISAEFEAYIKRKIGDIDE